MPRNLAVARTGVTDNQPLWQALCENVTLTLEKAQDNLISLLQRWKAGELEDSRHIQDDAETIEEKLIERGLIDIGNESEGLAAQVDNVLGQLTNAQAQFVLPIDIDIMLTLLNASGEGIPEAIKTHEKYWNALDYDARESEVKKYWFGE